MINKTLGETDLNITPIGFGAWAIGGGGWAFGWGAQDDSESIAAIQRALDLGVNWIDTAAMRLGSVMDARLAKWPSPGLCGNQRSPPRLSEHAVPVRSRELSGQANSS